MQVNFAQLFHINNQKSIKFNPKISQASTSRGIESLFASQASPTDKSSKKIKTKPKTLYAKKKPIQEILKIQQAQNPTQYNYFIPSRLNTQNDTYESPKKIIKKQDMKQIIAKTTQRLFQPTQCNKKKCKTLELESYYENLKRDHIFVDKPMEKRHNRNLGEICELLKKPSKLHNRLYLEYKQREFRNLELENEQKQIQQQKSKGRASQNDNCPYLKNYESFYSRLEHEVALRLKRDQYFVRHKNISMQRPEGDTKFEPNIKASMHSLKMISKKPKITPKIQKNKIKGRAEMNRQNSQYQQQSNSNKNEAILKGREDKIIDRICSLFESEEGLIDICPQNISKMDEAEFNIFFPLLQQIQQLEISSEQFYQLVQQYVQELPIPEKQEIRHNKKYLQKNSKQQEYKNYDQNHIHHKSDKNKDKDKGKAYLRKLQNFV